MQGWRISMEDSHAAVLDLQNSDKAAKPTTIEQRLSFFGVYDGHGGDKVALFSGENVHKILAKQSAFEAGNFEQALKDGFLATDRAILQGTEAKYHVEGELADDVACQTPATRTRSLAAPLRPLF
jgi:protein phosphatase 2C family protein 2/3